MSFCLDTYLQQSDNYEIHASKAGFKDCAMIIRFKADDIVYIETGIRRLVVATIIRCGSFVERVDNTAMA